MKDIQIYDKAFYDAQAQGSYRSAMEILPYINKLFNPKSIIDVGCGVGTWLKAWKDINSSIFIAGVDGNDMSEEMFFIPKKSYQKVDLTQDCNTLSLKIKNCFSNSVDIIGGGGCSNKPFDLAQSLEVAEHLDAICAENFVSLLTSLTDVVFFSAAIPLQGGVHHINEQPPEYWAKIFIKHDFECFDILREKFWKNKNIETWYRQNILIFIHKDKKALLKNYAPSANPLYLVHPEIWEERAKMANRVYSLEEATKHWQRKYNKTIPKRLERFFKKLFRRKLDNTP